MDLRTPPEHNVMLNHYIQDSFENFICISGYICSMIKKKFIYLP